MSDKETLPGIPTTLPKGTVVTLNGVKVEFDENLHFRILDAVNFDQAASSARIAELPCDFAHFDEEKNVYVDYHPYNAERIETTPEVKAQQEKVVAEQAKAAAKEEAAEAETVKNEPAKEEVKADEPKVDPKADAKADEGKKDEGKK